MLVQHPEHERVGTKPRVSEVFNQAAGAQDLFSSVSWEEGGYGQHKEQETFLKEREE